MGEVYRVADQTINEEVALKVLKPEIAADKKTIERFRNELKFARKVSHRNVCRMYDLSEIEGTSYITMEYVPGEDLKSFIRRVGQLPVGKAVSIAQQICEGLTEAHHHDVVHRDLKPQNIMIDKAGNAKIMDFGIARSITGKGITGNGVMIGTPEYMSPEQVEGKESDHRADIYAVGVIIYEMLTGKVPFEGDSPLTVAVKHKTEEPIPLNLHNAQIPEILNDLILRCMQKDREKRFQDTGELLAELKKIESGPTPASGVSRLTRVTRPKKRKTALIVSVSIVVIAAAALLFVMFRGPRIDADPNLVAVATFENKTGNPSLDHLGPMAADWTTQGLTSTKMMEVVPSSSLEAILRTYQGGDIIHFLAKKTGAGLVVSGSYYIDGDSIQFQAQITDSTKGKILRALPPVEGPADNPTKVIESLRLKLMAVMANIFEPLITGWGACEGEPQNYEAFLEFLAGCKFFIRMEFQEALKHLHRALELDPDWTSPLFMAAVNHLNLSEYALVEPLIKKLDERRETLGPSDRIHLDWFKAVLRCDRIGKYRASHQLVELNPGTTWEYQLASDALRINRPRETIEALSNLDPAQGLFKQWYPYWGHLTAAHHILGDHEQELKEAQRARKQYPDSLAVLWYETRALAAMGKINEVKRRLDDSLNFPDQNAAPGYLMRYAARELRAHDFKEAAMEIAERSVAWYKSHQNGSYRYSIAVSLYEAERWNEAKSIFEELYEQNPDNTDCLGYLGTLAARMGNREEAEDIFNKLKGLYEPYICGNNTFVRALIASLLGEKDEAIDLLRKALQEGESYLSLHAEMDLEPLYDYLPFQELIKPKE
jgi:serine/threonine protein kinase/tetratricopeptide (TPR) repeat protein